MNRCCDTYCFTRSVGMAFDYYYLALIKSNSCKGVYTYQDDEQGIKVYFEI